MRFTLSARIEPSGAFGVPQEGYVVVPAAPGRQVYGPTIDSVTGQVAGHGSFSQYREDSDAVTRRYTIADGEIVIQDNFFAVTLEDQDTATALNSTQALLERFLVQLSVRVKRAFTYEILSLTDNQQRAHPVRPRAVVTMNVTLYNLEELGTSLDEAAEAGTVTDETLERASEYFATCDASSSCIRT